MDKLHHIRTELDAAIKPGPNHRHHLTINAVGWPADESGATTRPASLTISNALAGFDVDAADQFSMESHLVLDRHDLRTYGQPMPSALKKRFRRDVTRRLSVNSSPGTVGVLLIRAVQAVTFMNPMVGAEMLFSYIPKPMTREITPVLMDFGRAPDWSKPVYRWLPAQPNPALISRMPTWVQGGQIIAGGMVGPKDSFENAPNSFRPGGE
jgi:hypothetical protein